MTTLKRCALNVCYDCAVRVMSGDESAWKLADRVERRWRIQGATQHHVDRMRKQEAEFKREESRRHDRLNPDRLTYLHR